MLSLYPVGDDQTGNPFVIGDILHICAAADHASDEEQLGVIIGFYKTSGGNLGINFVPQRAVGSGLSNAHPAATSVIYVKKQDRVTAHSNLLGKDDLGAPGAGTLSLDAPTYTISDLEMLCESVQPPEAYTKGMVKKAMTEQGVSMDILTAELHRFNQTNTQGITQIQIPTLAKRAKSLIVQPIPTSAYRDTTAKSFSGIPDNARDYQFQFGNHLVPTRKASLLRYSQSPAKVEPLHITEVQKSLVNISRYVYSLQDTSEHFIIARAFNRYGQITDLSDETISLRVDYNAGGSLKIFNNYVFKLARVTISKGAVVVES